MNNFTTLGRILFAIPFGLFGINHLFLYDWYVGNFTSFLPIGPFSVITTGIIMILVSISIITKKYITLSTQVLAVMLFIFIAAIHVPHLINGEDTTMVTITLLKDISLIGGSLMISGMCSREDNQNTTTKN
ncbi:DoxX family protein [Geofilum rubicundum]|uniref:DoxX family protein n=1 Tax=Geofilum rubicundum JCM 15548 TaxID=1236989 RepID=A0A0E9LZK8_9BACT|nr:hypothetical protein [Geofilum rubicundum]GAO30743.1 hypothetical protein JCM15548_13049 [Geofilum rubicundum JCM 15548]